jgi:nitroreductase
MHIANTIQNRRSCRIFEPRQVEADKIETITKAILWSPTSKNNRPWEFIWVDDQTLIQALANCKPHGAEFMAGAPLALVILAEVEKSDVWIEDTAIAATLAQLTAEDMGLGSCWVQIRLRDNKEGGSASDYCRTVLNIPDNYEVASIIAMGYKQKERKPYTDEQLQREKVHFNKFGK